MNKWMKVLTLMLTLMLALSGCAEETATVPVVQVRMLTRAGAAVDSYAGVVVSENAVQVKREPGQSISEVFVTEGQEVLEGQKLFSYDSDELNLMLDRQELDMDRLEATIKEKKSQIADVEKELKTATGDAKTQLGIQLRQLENELRQAEYDEDDLQAQIDHTKQMLRNVDVKSPINGTVRKIDENAEVYMVIQQAGAYQVLGQINELNLNAGIKVGTEVTVVSRLDESITWSGKVTSVDYNNTSVNAYDNMYGNADALSSSTSYPFYITLDSTEGLLLGQHVYIRLAGINQGSTGRILVPESYLTDVSYDDTTMITSAGIWCANGEGKLEKRNVVLGEYQADVGCYVILDGLSMEDYVADPENPDCVQGAEAQLRSDEDFDTRPVQTPETEETIGEFGDSGESVATEGAQNGADEPADAPADEPAEE